MSTSPTTTLRYRAVWHNAEGVLEYGTFTQNKEAALNEAKFKRALGFTAWTEDEEHNRVD